MVKNLGRPERLGRVVLGVGGLLVAVLAGGWAGGIRGLVGLVGVVLLVTALSGY